MGKAPLILAKNFENSLVQNFRKYLRDNFLNANIKMKSDYMQLVNSSKPSYVVFLESHYVIKRAISSRGHSVFVLEENQSITEKKELGAHGIEGVIFRAEDGFNGFDIHGLVKPAYEILKDYIS